VYMPSYVIGLLCYSSALPPGLECGLSIQLKYSLFPNEYLRFYVQPSQRPDVLYLISSLPMIITAILLPPSPCLLASIGNSNLACPFSV